VVHFDYLEALVAQKCGHGDAMRTGAFDSDPSHQTNRRKPMQQSLVTRLGRSMNAVT
jgi:hypothetical protein